MAEVVSKEKYLGQSMLLEYTSRSGLSQDGEYVLLRAASIVLILMLSFLLFVGILWQVHRDGVYALLKSCILFVGMYFVQRIISRTRTEPIPNPSAKLLSVYLLALVEKSKSRGTPICRLSQFRENYRSTYRLIISQHHRNPILGKY